MPATAVFFERYPNETFVETGTYRGDGVRQALAAGCFREIRSVELSHDLQARNRTAFAQHRQVRLYEGTSEACLWEMIRDIRTPITFWLDAHYSGDDTVQGPEMCPLIKELALIARHPVKTHTILIDDRRCFGTRDFSHITEPQAREFILTQINPAYLFSHDTASTAHSMFKEDVLVAHIPQTEKKR